MYLGRPCFPIVVGPLATPLVDNRLAVNGHPFCAIAVNEEIVKSGRRCIIVADILKPHFIIHSSKIGDLPAVIFVTLSRIPPNAILVLIDIGVYMFGISC